ncbi:MAG: site-2 protease family protein [Anaerolineae bacterium]|nr:site-2 protease family protein [Anaerolineae bacterium]NUQ03721.1 site-2 protease family protein [Anaerolineae bacterium]
MLLDRTPEQILATLIALGIGMTLHEYAHNYVGWRMGDPEPARQGRLTLNPLVHINWVGWLMFILIGFGFLGAAPISPYRMPRENRRWRWLAAVAAGPVSNLLVAVLVMLVIRILGMGFVGELPDVVNLILAYLMYFNVILFIFNLLPLFPIDGWNILYALLPPNLAEQWHKYQSTTQLIFFGVLLLTFVQLPGIPNIGQVLFVEPARSILRAGLGNLLYLFYF